MNLGYASDLGYASELGYNSANGYAGFGYRVYLKLGSALGIFDLQLLGYAKEKWGMLGCIWQGCDLVLR